MRKIIVSFIVMALLWSCSGNKPRPDWSAAEYYRYAMKKFLSGDYYDAANEFSVVVLRYAGSAFADSAQFYLGESHFFNKEYLIAASEYEKLILNMGRSPLVPMAQFKLGESYYKLSPRPGLDQGYTERAIREYQNFIEDYPTHELREEAERKIAELRDKLSFKHFTNAKNYIKMRKYKSALIYFDLVLNNFYDTQYADDALLGKIEVYELLQDYEAIKDEYIRFLKMFPNSKLLSDVQSVVASLPKEYQNIEE